jgi:hypothetical protein
MQQRLLATGVRIPLTNTLFVLGHSTWFWKKTDVIVEHESYLKALW